VQASKGLHAAHELPAGEEAGVWFGGAGVDRAHCCSTGSASGGVGHMLGVSGGWRQGAKVSAQSAATYPPVCVHPVAVHDAVQ